MNKSEQAVAQTLCKLHNDYKNKALRVSRRFNSTCKINGFLDFLLSSQCDQQLHLMFSVKDSHTSVSKIQFSDFYKKYSLEYFNISYATKNLFNIPHSTLVIYFINSTFPSIFGNFVFQEFLEYAYNFIKTFIDNNNDIASGLVGSYLRSSYYFRDHLTQCFLNDISALSQPLTLDNLSKIFITHFEKNARILSDCHLKIIHYIQNKQLSELLSESIFDYFLKPIIDLMSYDPLIDESLTLKLLKMKTPFFKKSFSLSSVFSKLYLHIKNNFSDKIYDILKNEDGMTYPSFSRVYFGICKFQLSLTTVDIEIFKILVNRNKKCIPKIQFDFYEQAFIIGKYDLTSIKFEYKDIPEYKDYEIEQRFNLKISFIKESYAELKKLSCYTNAAKNVLASSLRKYSRLYLKSFDKHEISYFQLTNYFKQLSKYPNDQNAQEEYNKILQNFSNVDPCNFDETKNVLCDCVKKNNPNLIIDNYMPKLFCFTLKYLCDTKLEEKYPLIIFVKSYISSFNFQFLMLVLIFVLYSIIQYM